MRQESAQQTSPAADPGKIMWLSARARASMIPLPTLGPLEADGEERRPWRLETGGTNGTRCMENGRARSANEGCASGSFKSEGTGRFIGLYGCAGGATIGRACTRATGGKPSGWRSSCWPRYWQDTETLLKCYQQPDNEAPLAVTSEERKPRE